MCKTTAVYVDKSADVCGLLWLQMGSCVGNNRDDFMCRQLHMTSCVGSSVDDL